MGAACAGVGALSMWGYAHGNPIAVGIVVAVLVIAAIAFIVARIWNRRG